jgi:hypothetical protein
MLSFAIFFWNANKMAWAVDRNQINEIALNLHEYMALYFTTSTCSNHTKKKCLAIQNVLTSKFTHHIGSDTDFQSLHR